MRLLRIGSLTGWDSDNGTATIAGMLGLMLGDAAVEAAFAALPGYPAGGLSDRFDIDRTRDNMPDYLPGDAQAQDTLTLLSQRMMPLVASAIAESGGVVSDSRRLVLPPALAPETAQTQRFERVATTRLARRSHTLAFLKAGVVPGTSSNVNSSPTTGGGNVVGSPSYIRTALDVDFLDGEHFEPNRRYYSSQGGGQAEGDELVLTVTFASDVPTKTVRVTEGDHFSLAANGVEGGWFTSVEIELLIGGAWTPAGASPSQPLDPALPFQIIDFELPATLDIRGVRLRGVVGTGGFATVSDLDAFAPEAPAPTPRPTFDRNGSGGFDVEDLHTMARAPGDLDGDGDTDEDDRAYLVRAYRALVEP